MSYGYKRKSLYLGNIEITTREVIASVSIIAIMLLVGLLIAGKISERQEDKNSMYNKALKVAFTDIFQHGMETDVGNAFVYGELNAVDTVSYPDVEGEYMYIEKVKERYTMHTRTVTTTTADGKTETRTETYWTWDEVGSEELTCKEVEFCGVVFDSSKIEFPEAKHIDTIK